jgi:hypothetical protein
MGNQSFTSEIDERHSSEYWDAIYSKDCACEFERKRLLSLENHTVKQVREFFCEILPGFKVDTINNILNRNVYFFRNLSDFYTLHANIRPQPKGIAFRKYCLELKLPIDKESFRQVLSIVIYDMDASEFDVSNYAVDSPPTDPGTEMSYNVNDMDSDIETMWRVFEAEEREYERTAEIVRHERLERKRMERLERLKPHITIKHVIRTYINGLDSPTKTECPICLENIYGEKEEKLVMTKCCGNLSCQKCFLKIDKCFSCREPLI